MTTNAEARAAAHADYDAAIDQAQQVFRAAIEAPAAEYIAATEGARAELETAEATARQVYADALAAIGGLP